MKKFIFDFVFNLFLTEVNFNFKLSAVIHRVQFQVRYIKFNITVTHVTKNNCFNDGVILKSFSSGKGKIEC